MASGVHEKQGYLGNLEQKSTAELKDLLARQQKLLKNRTFILGLPDKGVKIKNIVKRLEEVLALHRQVDSTADLFHQMSLDAESARRVQPSDDDPLRDIVNMEHNDKVIVDERENSETYINSYQRVIMAEKRTTSKKFMPSRCAKVQYVQDLNLPSINKTSESGKKEIDKQKDKSTSQQIKTAENRSDISVVNEDDSKNKSLSQGGTTTNNGHTCRLKFRYDESLETDTTRVPPKHQSAKLISVEESIQIQKAQNEKQEILQTRQAAEKLIQRLNIKMTTFDPEGSRKLVYREKDENASDDEDRDYPD